MIIHVLPGDAQVETFNETGIEGELVVCRECLIEGPVDAANLEDFWRARAEFLEVDLKDYLEKTVSGFEQLSELALWDEANLWFEYELFCQANMWFVLSLLNRSDAEVYRVEPVVRNEDEIWKGFGKLDAADFQKCFARRTKFEKADIQLGADLWDAYRNKDHQKLAELSNAKSACFPYLKEVCEAEIEKETRPARILKELAASGLTDFSEIFPAFTARAGVYGYGDSQVKRILDQV